jgi:hypothetical protein
MKEDSLLTEAVHLLEIFVQDSENLLKRFSRPLSPHKQQSPSTPGTRFHLFVGDRGLESYRFGTGLVSCLIGIKQDILDLFSSSTQAEQSACYRPNKNPLKADVVCGR